MTAPRTEVVENEPNDATDSRKEPPEPTHDTATNRHRDDRQPEASDFELHAVWHNSGNALFAALRFGSRGAIYRLIVEQLPCQNAWDWTVWRPGDTREAPRHGRAASAEIGMAAAEQAVRRWIETTSAGD